MWDVYNAVRQEIMLNHALMHWVSLAIAITLLTGTAYCETRTSVLSALLPLLGVAWAAATLRFDFLIHRQGAYLQHLETTLTQQGGPILWETWKQQHHAQNIALPILDLIASIPIIAATAYLAFRPATQYLTRNAVPGARAYPWAIIILQLTLLALLGIIPTIARR